MNLNKFSRRMTEEFFQVYALLAYENTNCLSEKEYKDDLQRLVTIKRLVSRYINGESVNIRILVNSIICFYNVFKHDAAIIMIFHRLDVKQYPYIKTILGFLNLIPKSVFPEFRDISTIDSLRLELEKEYN